VIYPLITALLLSAPSAHPTLSLGTDACELVENLPGAKAPIRQHPDFRQAYRLLARAQGHVRKLAQVRRVLEKKAMALLERARKVFKETNQSVKRTRVRRFLDAHLYAETPSLLLRDEGFVLPGTVSATLAWLNCREGRFQEAIMYARPVHREPGSLVAFASLLLVERGRLDEAMELQSSLGSTGFLPVFMQSELAKSFQERLRFHRMATLAARTQAQRLALKAQRLRHPALGGR
jgi:hypothetical protein